VTTNATKGEKKNLTGTDKLPARIDSATRRAKEDYEIALETVSRTKEKMNELERRISRKKPEEYIEDMNQLSFAIDSLDRLTDSQIMKSKEMWNKYEELKHECGTQTLQPPQLDELRII